MSDLIERQATIEALRRAEAITMAFGYRHVIDTVREMPSADLEEYSDKLWKAAYERGKIDGQRQWISCSNPPKHHKDVIVRGIEAIGNVTVHKVMQWDVDTWRPTDYAPSIIWEEWSEI